MTFTLPQDFINQFNDVKPFENNPYGEMIFLRTYSRKKDDGSMETFQEVVRRCVEACYNMQMVHMKQHKLPFDMEKAIQSAEEMYCRMVKMKFLPGGRCLAPNTIVAVPGGSVRLDKVEIGDIILTRSGNAMVVGIHKDHKKLLRIKTNCSYFDCSAEHKVAIFDGNSVIFRHAGSLCVGDRLVHLSERSSPSTIPNITYKTGDYQLQVTGKVAYVLGVVFNLNDETKTKIANIINPLGYDLGQIVVDRKAIIDTIEEAPFFFQRAFLSGLLQVENNGMILLNDTKIASRLSSMFSNNNVHYQFEHKEGNYFFTIKQPWNLFPPVLVTGIEQLDQSDVIDLSLSEQPLFRSEYAEVIKAIHNDERITSQQLELFDLMLKEETLADDSHCFYANGHLVHNSLWAMGTPITEERHLYEALFNCAFTSTVTLDKTNAEPFKFIMDCLMCGVGCGFDTDGAKTISIKQPKWSALSKLLSSINVIDNLIPIEIGKIEESEKKIGDVESNILSIRQTYREKGTNLTLLEAIKIFAGLMERKPSDNLLHLIDEISDQKEFVHIVEDSREGWVNALGALLNSYFKGEPEVQFNYSLIREAGLPIKGFGGKASGYTPLRDLLENVRSILSHRVGSLITQRDIVDIANMIAKCVISGNVRRCLPINSQVLTDHGNVPIQDVTVGTKVMTSNGFQPITAIFKQGIQKLIKIEMSDPKYPSLICTPNHRVSALVVIDGRIIKTWRFAGELIQGDSLCHFINDENWDYPEIEKLSDGGSAETFDLEVANMHEFVCGEYLVHNSAEIALGKADEEFISLKDYSKNPDRMAFGWASNNTVICKLGDDYSEIAKRISINGEPGIFWRENAQNYSRMNGIIDRSDHKAMGLNPCGETILEADTDTGAGELCNLMEVPITNAENLEDFKRTLKFAYLYAKILTLTTTNWSGCNRIMLRNRRIGCGLTGVAQFIDMKGLNELKQWCEEGYETLERYDEIYSDWLAIPRSKRMTVVKPSGTLSLLAKCTPGIHYPPGGVYCIRRTRIAANHPMLKYIRAAGYHVEPDVFNPTNTMVIESPLHFEGIKRCQKDVSMWEQLSYAEFMQRHWADNSVSVTITFNKDESKVIENALSIYQYKLKSLSMLPIGNETYPQMPYEEISKEKYEEMLLKVKPIDFAEYYRSGGEDTVAEKYCTNDSCDVVRKEK